MHVHCCDMVSVTHTDNCQLTFVCFCVFVDYLFHRDFMTAACFAGDMWYCDLSSRLVRPVRRISYIAILTYEIPIL